MTMRTHTFRGVRYRILTDEVVHGLTEGTAPSQPLMLYISANLSGRSRLEVAIHEAMHAEDMDVDEKVIDRRAASMARFLWRLGYRAG